MNFYRLFLLMSLFGLTNLAHAADEPEFVSQTFREIQSRVSRRDEPSLAILEVKTKADAPRLDFDLNFSIQEVPYTDEVIIVLSRRLKAGDGIYEKYRLRLDDDLRQELQNQQQLKKLEVERRAQSIEPQKLRISKISGGQLNYGMSLEEVVKVKGKPEKIGLAQAIDTFTAVYSDMSLGFWMNKLSSIGPGSAAERIQQMRAEIGQLETQAVPARGTTRQQVERIFGEGQPQHKSSKIGHAEAAPQNSLYRSYKFADLGTLSVTYDVQWKVVVAGYVDPFSTKGRSGFEITSIEQLRRIQRYEVEPRLEQMKRIVQEYKKLKEQE